MNTLRLVTAAAILMASQAHAASPIGQPQSPQKTTPVAAPSAPLLTGSNLIVHASADLSVANAVVADGAAVDLKATLRNKATNAPLVDQTIEFKIDGKAAAIIKTDANGMAWVKGHKAPSDMSAGAHVLEAHFAGNDGVSPATSTGNFALLAAKTVMEMIEPSYGSILPGSEQAVMATLYRDTDKLLLGNAKVRLLVDGTEVPSTPTKGSNANGYYAPGVVTVQLNFKWPAQKYGNIPVKVAFDGSEKLLPTASNVVIMKTPPAPTVITPVTMAVDPILGTAAKVTYCGQNLILIASMKNLVTQSPVKGAEVNFTLKGDSIGHVWDRPIGTAITNANGMATLNTIIPDSFCFGGWEISGHADVDKVTHYKANATTTGAYVGSAAGTTQFTVVRP